MSKPTSVPGSLFVVAIVVVAAVAFALQRRHQPAKPLPAPLAQVKIAGWTNTQQPPTAEDLAGKWVVVDCWATWCGPCIMSMPELAEFRRQWPEDEVVVIGLADDDAAALPQIQRVIESVPGFNWPVAYGGGYAMQQLGISGIPTLILYSPDGEEVVRGHDIERIEAFIVAGRE